MRGFRGRSVRMNGMRTTPKRRWFSVSLRELALILLALGLGLGWYRERQRWEPIRSRAHAMYGGNDGAWRGFPLEYTIDGIPIRVYVEHTWPPPPQYESEN